MWRFCMNVQLLPIEKQQAPKLLLDANIFRELADGGLEHYKERLRKVSSCRSPPLLWACPITFEELVCHLRATEAKHFEHFRQALIWMDELCGNDGIAEDLPWILNRGVFATAQPYQSKLTVAVNRVRRQIAKAASFDRLSTDILHAIEQTRSRFTENVDRWTAGRAKTLQAMRIPPSPDDQKIEASGAVGRVVVETSRKHAALFSPIWGGFRTEEDQKLVQREMIAFTLSDLLKARNPGGYNVYKHKTDYNDGWLCAYPAAGYMLVTLDSRLRNALKQAGCKSPRVLNIGEALDVAEMWLDLP
jgi:hypothetical protein